jgi:hypothetical protein
MAESIRGGPLSPAGQVEVPSELDFWIEAEQVLERARDVAEWIQSRTDEVAGAQATADSDEFGCAL